MWFEYLPSESLYDNIYYEDQKIIVWPDLDSVDSYSWMNKKEILDYIQWIIDWHKSYYEDAWYLITFIWSNNWKKMIDIWKYTENPVDDRSWPLSDVVVYEDWKPCHWMWIASGNTLFVLGYEEKLRRQSSSLEEYLAWPAPTLPLDIINGKNFFDYNKS